MMKNKIIYLVIIVVLLLNSGITTSKVIAQTADPENQSQDQDAGFISQDQSTACLAPS